MVSETGFSEEENMNHNTLASALERRSNAERELDQAVLDVEDLSRQDLAGVESEEYEAVMEHFNQMMAAWELAQQEVENEIPLEEMDADIDKAFKYCTSARNIRLELVRKWDEANIPKDRQIHDTRGTEQSQIADGWKIKGGKKRKHQEPKRDAQELNIKNSVCTLCGEVHAIATCKAFLRKTVPHRLECCKAKRLCFRCLGTTHFSRSCSNTCDHCNGKHHITLCYALRRKHKGRAHVSRNVSSEQTAAVLTSNMSFRPTDCVSDKKKDGGRQAETASFDSGAHRPYVALPHVESEVVNTARFSPIGFVGFCHSMEFSVPDSSFGVQSEGVEKARQEKVENVEPERVEIVKPERVDIAESEGGPTWSCQSRRPSQRQSRRLSQRWLSQRELRWLTQRESRWLRQRELRRRSQRDSRRLSFTPVEIAESKRVKSEPEIVEKVETVDMADPETVEMAESQRVVVESKRVEKVEPEKLKKAEPETVDKFESKRVEMAESEKVKKVEPEQLESQSAVAMSLLALAKIQRFFLTCLWILQVVRKASGYMGRSSSRILATRAGTVFLDGRS
jgi:hypothetical protein